MKILVAPNSFKESLNCFEVAKHIRIGLQKACKKFKIIEIPLADGGIGTSILITKTAKGKFVRCKVTDPLNRKIYAKYGIIKGKTAVIELAQAAGLELVAHKYRNPLRTSTKGVGEMILDAINRGYKKIILGIGDSATIDCGIGALSILGVRFLDKNNNEIELNCRGLLSLQKIDDSKIPRPVKNAKIIVIADVRNRLTGKNGALMYARQKGATDVMIPSINQALRNFKLVILKKYSVDLDKIAGSGAAGGIGGAMKVILNAEIKSGFDVIEKMIALEKRIKQSDFIITGEGRIDKQNFYGKTTKRVVDLSCKNNKPVILIAGVITSDAKVFYKCGSIGLYSIFNEGAVFKKIFKKTPRLIENLAYSIGKTLIR